MLLSILCAFAPAFVDVQDPRIQAETAPPSTLYFGDLDGDGLDDALVIGPRGGVTLLVNRGEGRFEDLTLASGLARVEFASCALFADFDGDARTDLFLGSSEQRLWRNLGNASFEPIASGIEHDLVDLSALALDHDHDGLVDLHLHTEAGDLLYRNTGKGLFERVELVDSDHAALVALLVSSDSATGETAPLDESPSRRRLRRWLSFNDTRTAASRTSLATPDEFGDEQLANTPLALGNRCPQQIRDQANGSCMYASTTATLGMLYPLSTNLNVSAGGNVGIGTTTPGQKLDVAGNLHASGVIDVRGLRTSAVDIPGTGGVSATNVVGGHTSNYLHLGGEIGATIAGGGSTGDFFGTPTLLANIVSDDFGTVGGGDRNRAGNMDAFGDNATHATVAGGQLNRAAGEYATVGGGESNVASGASSSIPGGSGNLAQADYTFAAGRSARALHAGAFVWADSNGDAVSAASLSSTAVDQFLIRAGGGVGIGTNAPEAPVHVAEGSAGTVTANANASAVFERNGSCYLQLLTPNADESGVMFGNPGHAAAGGIYYNSTAADGLAFRVSGNSTKLVIDSNGNVGIGTTSPSFLLHVNGSAGKPGGGSWSVASDARLKKNVAELDGALEKLLELRGVNFEYIDPAAIGEREGTHTGFIAQEVERVFPEWVGEKGDGTKYVSVTGFEALTVEALREVRAENHELREELDRRGRELDELRAAVQALASARDSR